MDDIVIVLITLVIMVVGAINQFRKKPKEPLPNETSEKESPRLNFWEEFLDVETENNIEPQNPVFEEVEAPVEKPEPKPVIQPAFEEGKHTIPQNYIRDTIKDSEIGIHKKKINLPEGFSLKKAIIFSEVINPKYF